MHRQNWRRLIRDFLLLGLIGAAHLYFLGTILLSPLRIRELIESETERRFTSKIDISDLDLNLPGELILKDIRSAGGPLPGTGPWLKASSVRLQVDTLELLRGRVQINQIEVRDPELVVDVSAGPGGKVVRRVPPRAAPAGPKSSRPHRSFLALDDISVIKGRVTLLNVPGYGQNEPVEFSGISAQISRIQGLHRGLRVTGDITSDWLPHCGYRLDIDERARTIRGDINAEDVQFSAALFQRLPTQIVQKLQPVGIQGNFDLNFGFRFNWDTGEARDLSLTVDLTDCMARHRDYSLAVSNLFGQLKTDGRDLLVREMTGRLGSASFHLAGHRIQEGLQPDEGWVIGLSGLPLDESLRSNLPPEAQKVWGQIGPEGTIDAELKIAGNSAGKTLLVSSFKSRDLQVNYFRFRYPSSILDGEIEWDGQQFLLRNIQVRSDKTKAVLSGNIFPGHTTPKHVHLDIKDGVLDSRAREALSKKDQRVWDLLSPSGPVDGTFDFWRDSEGKLRFQIRVTGGNPGLVYRHFPVPVTLSAGTAVWSREKATLKEIEGRHGKTTFKLDADFHFHRPAEGDRVIVTTKRLALDQALKGALKKDLVEVWEQLSPKGMVEATYQMVGQKNHRWHYSLQTLSTQAQIIYRSFPFPAVVKKCELEWDDESVKLLNVELEHGSGSALLRGEIGRKNGRPFVLHFDFENLELNEQLRQALPPETRSIWDAFKLAGHLSGTLDVSADIQGQPKYELLARSEDAVLIYRKMPLPVSMAQIHLLWDDRGATLQQLSGKVGDGNVTLNGTFPLDGTATSCLNILGKGLLLDEQVRQALPDSARAGWKRFKTAGHADVEGSLTWKNVAEVDIDYALTIDCKDVRFSYPGFPVEFDHLQGKVSINGSSLTIPKLNGLTRGHPATIEGGFSWSNGGAAPDLLFHIESVPLDEKLYLLLPTDYQELWEQFGPQGTLKTLTYQIRTDAKGNIEQAFSAEMIDGRLSYSRFPISLSKVHGLFSWKGGEMKFENLAGKAFGGSVRASGGVSSSGMKMTVALQGLTFSEKLFLALPKTLQDYWQEVNPVGALDVKTTVNSQWSTRENKSTFRAEISLKDAEAVVGFQLKDMTGILRLNGEIRGEELVSLEGTSVLDEVEIRGEKLKDLTAIIVLQGGRLTVKELRGAYHGGLIRAQITQKVDETQTPLTSVKVALSDLEVADYASRFGSSSKLSGLMRGEMDFTLRGKDIHSLRGRGTINVDRGELWALPALDLINSFLKSSTNKVQEVAMDFLMEGTKLKVNLLKLVGEQYNIYGAGEVDFDWQMHLTLYVAKRSILQNAVEAIPAGPLTKVLSDLVTSLQAALYQVEAAGPIHKPVLKNVPFKGRVPSLILKEMRKDGSK